MNIDDLLHRSGEWLKETNTESSVVLSSRVRLARNLTNSPFPNRANAEQRREVYQQIMATLKGNASFADAMFLDLEMINDLDSEFLIERHLMSHALAQSRVGSGLVVSKDEAFSIMINEEDHLRLQLIQSGSKLATAWLTLNKIDDELSAQLAYAYTKDYGYLTACPTNTGTAMRASVMVHLPGLVMTGRIEPLLNAFNKLNFIARGFYGEGSHALGNFFQISNQVSLGVSEAEIIDKTTGVIERFIEQEMEARSILLSENKISIEDRIYRAHGLLKNARIISSQEAIELISLVRFGIDLGIIDGVDYQNLNEGFLIIQPAHLQKLAKRELDAEERDQLRAEVIRNLVA